jgi:endonuclease/exonuclease/phosphatase family metal-dependent hydrolase
VLQRLDPDVIALQEVEGVDWEIAAADLGYHAVVQHPGDTPFGNALLSRAPAKRFTLVDLSVPGRERRGAIDAEVETGEDSLRVVTTHLGLRGYERRRQAARLGDHLESEPCDLATVVLGDLNDWTPWARQLASLAERVGPFSRDLTFPSRRPVLALDRVAVLCTSRRGIVAAVRDADARIASDHLPLHVTLEPAGTRDAMR